MAPSCSTRPHTIGVPTASMAQEDPLVVEVTSQANNVVGTHGNSTTIKILPEAVDSHPPDLANFGATEEMKIATHDILVKLEV